MEPTENSNRYPVFEPNQVLSDKHLNQLFGYLDEQERLTRANLSGIGIVCGLEFKLVGNNIILSKGCGVTSHGYLIVEPDDVILTSYRSYTLPSELDYEPFRNNTPEDKPQFDLLELFPDGKPDTTPLVQDILDDKVLLLFFELKQQPLRNCSPNNCDDKGAAVTATVRRLLVNKGDLENTVLPGCFELPEIPVSRIDFSTPEHLRNYENTYKEFFASAVGGKTAVVRLADALGQAYAVLSGLMLNLDNAGVSTLQSKFIFGGSVLWIQYYYDLLRDLTAAYHELRTMLLQQTGICIPANDLFQRHLVLGTVKGGDPAQYRTAYFPSSAATLARRQRELLRFLFERINQMVLKFGIPSGAIRITPSRWGMKQLSGKSMPFYFEPALRQQWDASGAAGREILSWHGYDDSSSPVHVRDPLQYDLEPYNFFRVEGHIGKSILEVTAGLAGLVRNKRLPFSILHLDADAVGDFLEQHHAIEHEAGVTRGGTFVVVHRSSGTSANLALCDFMLPYRIEQTHASDCFCRTAIRECAYEWFDSRQHLNNIVRHKYIPAESREADKNLLVKYYVIVIYRYSIQGQELVAKNKPEQVRIPLSELADGQLPVIARKLNEKYPNGLLFDYDAQTNKLLIRYFADQTFRIEWGGLQGNQIRYAYTPEHVYRWQKGKWQALDTGSKYKVTCRLRDEYCADQYKWLHRNACYAAQYPSSGQVPTLGELIKWEKMLRTRAAQKNLPISELLSHIKSLVDENYNAEGLVVEVVLIGSWANGSWVSRNGAENNFPAGFLPLRQKITGKTGPSDIDLLVYSESVIKPEDILKGLNEDRTIKQCGYGINIVFGKRDAQRGIRIV